VRNCALGRDDTDDVAHCFVLLAWRRGALRATNHPFTMTPRASFERTSGTA